MIRDKWYKVAQAVNIPAQGDINFVFDTSTALFNVLVDYSGASIVLISQDVAPEFYIELRVQEDRDSWQIDVRFSSTNPLHENIVPEITLLTGSTWTSVSPTEAYKHNVICLFDDILNKGDEAVSLSHMFTFDPVKKRIRANYSFYSVGGVSALGFREDEEIPEGYPGLDEELARLNNLILNHRHSADAIDQTIEKRFVSTAQIEKWDSMTGTGGESTESAYVQMLKKYLKVSPDEKYLYSIIDFYSEKGVAALGAGSLTGVPGSGGAVYDLLDDWADYLPERSNWVLAAGLAYSLYTTVQGKQDSIPPNTYAPFSHRHHIRDIDSFTPYTHPDYSIEDGIGGTLGHIKASKMSALDILLGMFERKGAGTEQDPYLIEAKHSLYSLGGVSALGNGVSAGSSSGGYDRLDSWDQYNPERAGWVLSAGLAYALYQSAGSGPGEGYATEEWVTTKISELVNSAPGTLDTLKELALALGNDPNFSTTILSLIGEKEPHMGNPIGEGYLLSSSLYGTRSWVAPYSHPSSHPASMIEESSTRRFVSDSEKSLWNLTGNVLSEHIGDTSHLSSTEKSYLASLMNILKIGEGFLYTTVNFYSEKGISALGYN